MSATPRDAAFGAHAAGLCVLPPREDGTKAPMGDEEGKWEQYQARRSSEAELDGWYADGATGVGIVCGAVSGGLEMLELEGRAVAEGRSALFLELAEAAGLGELVARIRTGYQERTPSGGIHLLYRCPKPLPNTKLARRPATAAELAAKPLEKIKMLIETRGEGGYTITAPSNGRVHPTGGAWTLEAGGFATIATIADEERDALYGVARVLDEMPPAERPAPRSDRTRGTDDERPGDRFNAAPDVQATILELLERHGWTLVYAKGDVCYLRRPGKTIGISATLGYAGPGVLHVYSTSTDFEDGRSINPFAVYAHLEHGDDFSAAAAALEPPIRIYSNGVAPEPAAEAPTGPTGPPDAPETWPDPPAEAAYHGVLGDIARAVAPHTEADPVGILGTLVAMFGSACGGARSLYQGSMQRTNLSVLLVGETGFRGRKGTALDVVRSVFRLAYPSLEGLWLVGVASGEGISGHLVRQQDEDIRSGSTTPEDRVLLVEPEFGRLLTIMNREGSTLSAVLRNAWDGVPLGYARARDGLLVTRHHVTLIGHVTPVELRAKLTEVDAASGFTNRILFLAVRRTNLIPFPKSPDYLVADHIKPLRDAIGAAGSVGELEFDDAARDRWEWFYAELALTPRLGLAGAVTGRHEAQVARLALVYALADRSPHVGLAHLEAAIALAEYGRRSAVYALGDSTGNRHADVLRRMLVDGEIAFDDAKRALGLRTAADLADAVAVLVDAGLAEVVTIPQPKGGARVGSYGQTVQTVQTVLGGRARE